MTGFFRSYNYTPAKLERPPTFIGGLLLYVCYVASEKALRQRYDIGAARVMQQGTCTNYRRQTACDKFWQTPVKGHIMDCAIKHDHE